MEDVIHLITQKENRRLEFKRELPSLDKIIRSAKNEKNFIAVSSYVNDDGGVYGGVSDDNSVNGGVNGGVNHDNSVTGGVYGGVNDENCVNDGVNEVLTFV